MASSDGSMPPPAPSRPRGSADRFAREFSSASTKAIEETLSLPPSTTAAVMTPTMRPSTSSSSTTTLKKSSSTSTLLSSSSSSTAPSLSHSSSTSSLLSSTSSTTKKQPRVTSAAKSSSNGTKKRKKKKATLVVHLANCRYEILRKICADMGWKTIEEDGGDSRAWNLYWTDVSVNSERLMELRQYQRINHFPGMSEISRKNTLARNLNKMAKLWPSDYNFFPRSWALPSDWNDLQAYFRSGPGRKSSQRTLIVKPEAGCQGKGIFLTRSHEELSDAEHVVAQQYLTSPYLINGYKFDLRVYVLVTSCDPLRIYLFQDGLARFATVKYKEPTARNLSTSYMHLTNYSVNKHNEAFVQPTATPVPGSPKATDNSKGSSEDGNDSSSPSPPPPLFDSEAAAQAAAVDAAFAAGSCPSKMSIKDLFARMEKDGVDTDALWEGIGSIAIKTLLAVQPTLAHLYHASHPHSSAANNACFEVLGLDILLDKKLKPWLLEVNHSPSFHTDSPLDYNIKRAVILEAIQLVNINPAERRKYLVEEKNRIQARLFSRSSSTTKLSRDELAKKRAMELAKAEDERADAEEKVLSLGHYARIYPLPEHEDGTQPENPYSHLSAPMKTLFGETKSSQARRKHNEEKAAAAAAELAKLRGYSSQASLNAGESTGEPTRSSLRKSTSTESLGEPLGPKDKARTSAAATTSNAGVALLARARTGKKGNTLVPRRRSMGSTAGAAKPVVKMDFGLTPTQEAAIALKIDEREERVRIGEKMMRDNLVRCSGIREKLLIALGPGCNGPIVPPPPAPVVSKAQAPQPSSSSIVKSAQASVAANAGAPPTRAPRTSRTGVPSSSSTSAPRRRNMRRSSSADRSVASLLSRSVPSTALQLTKSTGLANSALAGSNVASRPSMRAKRTPGHVPSALKMTVVSSKPGMPVSHSGRNSASVVTMSLNPRQG